MYHPSLDTSEYKCGTMGSSEMDGLLQTGMCLIQLSCVLSVCVICGQRKLTVGEVGGKVTLIKSSLPFPLGYVCQLKSNSHVKGRGSEEMPY